MINDDLHNHDVFMISSIFVQVRTNQFYHSNSKCMPYRIDHIVTMIVRFNGFWYISRTSQNDRWR